MRDKSHDEAMAEEFKDDPAYALELLNDILADGDQAELRIALRQMVQAFGGKPVSDSADLTSLSAVLHAMGLRVAILPASVKLGSILAEIGREVGGADLDIARERSVSKPVDFGDDD